MQSDLGKLSQSVAGSKKLLAKLEKLGDHCPTCEQAVDPEFKQSLINDEARKIAEARKEEYEIEEEYQKLNETMQSMTLQEKISEVGGFVQKH